MVSICCITYNHEDFISKTIEGFLNQKINFDFEIIIGEDYSTDKTRKICKEYAIVDHRIKILENNTNLGMMNNFINSLNACSGKYIAYCEGDDLWSDENKLQIQVDFLEKNPSFVGTFHNVSVMENGIIIQQEERSHTKDVFTTDDFVINNPVPALSLVFRNVFNTNYPAWIRDCKIGDWPLWLSLAEQGSFKYFNRVMGCYRVHPQGSYYNTSKINWHKQVMLPTFDLMIKNAGSETVAQKIKCRKIEEALELNKLEDNYSEYIKNILLLILNRRYTHYNYRDLLYLLRNFRG